jgi:RNA polymerase sigma-70 factor, ECF subfamily
MHSPWRVCASRMMGNLDMPGVVASVEPEPRAHCCAVPETRVCDGSIMTMSTASDGSMDAQALAPREFERALADVVAPAYGYALRLTRHRADAEDLVQEAALLACRGRDGFQAGTNFKAWFFRIVTTCFWGKHRRDSRRPSTVEFEDAPVLQLYQRSAEVGLPLTGDNPTSALFDRLGTERVAEALAALPEEFGVVCTLYFMEDFAYHEIAEVLGVPVGTVRSRLHRGRRMLQKALWQVAVDAGIVGATTGN